MCKTDWKKKMLGEVVELMYGKGLPKRTRKKGNYPVYGSGGIIDYHNEFLIDGPGIIVGRKGNVGSVHYSKSNFFPIDTVFYIENKANKYNLRFVYYMLKISHLANLNSDAAVPGLNRNTAYLQEFKIPEDINKQRTIATILSNYDDLIENNTKRIKLLENMAQLIYKEWFVHFRYPGFENQKLVDSELGKIQEGWEVKGIFDVATVRYGKNLPSKKMQADEEYLVYGAAKIIGQYDEYNCETPKVITGCRGSCGQMKITKPKSFVTNNSFIFDFLEEQKLFFYHQLDVRGLQNYIGGTAQPQITLEGISGLKIVVPSANLIKQFNNIATPIFRQINLLDDVNLILQQTRDLLLPKLISGEIDVEEIEIIY